MGQAIIVHGALAQSTVSQTASAARSNAPLPAKTATVPFTPIPTHGGPLVRLRLNDTMDANVVVDTGCEVTLVSSRIVQALGLTKKPAPYMKDGVKPPPGIPTEIVTFDLVRIGGIEITSMDGYVSDFVVGNGSVPVDGYLGMDILKSFAILFDFESNQITFVPEGKLSDKQRDFLGFSGGKDAGTKLTGEFPKKQRFTVPVRIEMKGHGVTLSHVIDTGAQGSILIDTNNYLGLTRNQSYVSRPARGVQGEIVQYVFPVTAFGVGNTKEDAKRNNLAPFECAQTTPNMITSQSVLGLDYLSHFRVLFDYPAERLYLSPVAAASGMFFPTEASRQCARQSIAGAIVAPLADGKWRIESLYEGGVFVKAGGQVGDVIETINGKKVQGLLIYGISMLFNLKTGVNDVQLLRDGKPLQVKVVWQKQP